MLHKFRIAFCYIIKQKGTLKSVKENIIVEVLNYY